MQRTLRECERDRTRFGAALDPRRLRSEIEKTHRLAIDDARVAVDAGQHRQAIGMRALERRRIRIPAAKPGALVIVARQQKLAVRFKRAHGRGVVGVRTDAGERTLADVVARVGQMDVTVGERG